MTQNAAESFHVVGIGASAGGLKALESLFQHLPDSTGAAFVVVQHLSPDYGTLMDQILRRQTKLAVHVAEDGMVLTPEKIHLIPPGKNLTIQDGTLHLSDQTESRMPPLAIDILFDSLAQDLRERSIGIILSGTGTDGSVGIRSIKNAGGVVMIQDPETAEFDGMPRSALRTGVGDLVLAPEQMGTALANYLNASLLPLRGPAITLDTKPLTRVFEILESHTRIDFSLYRDKTLFRRIGRRMSILQTSSLEELVTRLEGSNEAIEALCEDLLIGVTEFFRDPDAHEIWTAQIDRLQEIAGNGAIRVWVPGCSTGEEAYTIAMCFEEFATRRRLPVDYKIFATDLNKRSLSHASEAVYSPAIVHRLGQERIDRFFRRVDRGYRVTPKIRGRVVFATHNLIQDPPFTRMHLISCRNLLIYLEREAQERAIRAMSFALQHSGVLVLGPSESLGGFSKHYETIDTRWKIYTRKGSATEELEHRPDPRIYGSGQGAGPVNASKWLDIERVSANLISEFVPACIVTDERGLILHSFGEPNRFLSMHAGRASLDLLQLLQPETRSFVASAMQRARESQKSIICEGLRFDSGAQVTTIPLTVRHLPPEDASSSFGVFVVSFGDPGAVSPRAVHLDLDRETLSRVQVLERELSDSRKNLHAVIEEVETSNEELQSTNEELLSSNEELQSTNEELHSVNEELYTVNAEHQRKIQELMELTADMENLLESIDVGTIFLDRDLLIRKFTPQARHIVQLQASDVGRPLHHLTHSFEDVDLPSTVNRVLQYEEPIEFEGDDLSGTRRLIRVLPYRSSGEVTGAVITMIDVQSIHIAKQALEETRSRFAMLVNTVDQVLWISRREDLSLVYVSPYLRELLGLADAPGQETVERWFARIHPEDREAVRRAWQETGRTGHFEAVYRVEDARGRLRWLQARAAPVAEADGEARFLAGTAQDITEHRRLQERLEAELRLHEPPATVDQETGIRSRTGLELAFVQQQIGAPTDRHTGLVLLRFNASVSEDADSAMRARHFAKLLGSTAPFCEVLARTDHNELAVLVRSVDRAQLLGQVRTLRAVLQHDDGEDPPFPVGSLGFGAALLTRDAPGLEPALDALQSGLSQRAPQPTELLLLDVDEREPELLENVLVDVAPLLLPGNIQFSRRDIFALANGNSVALELFGYSAHPAGRGPEQLTRLCAETGYLEQLELAKVRAALAYASAEPEKLVIVSMSPAMLHGPGFNSLRSLLRGQQSIESLGLLFPLSEFVGAPSLDRPQIQELAELGVQVGLAGVGSGNSSLEALLDFEPAFARYCPHLVATLREPGDHRARFERLNEQLLGIVPRLIAGPAGNDAFRDYLRGLAISWGQDQVSPLDPDA